MLYVGLSKKVRGPSGEINFELGASTLSFLGLVFALVKNGLNEKLSLGVIKLTSSLVYSGFISILQLKIPTEVSIADLFGVHDAPKAGIPLIGVNGAGIINFLFFIIISFSLFSSLPKTFLFALLFLFKML